MSGLVRSATEKVLKSSVRADQLCFPLLIRWLKAKPELVWLATEPMSRAERGSETQPPHHAQNRRASGTPEQCYVSTTFMLSMVYTFPVFAWV